MSFGNTNFSYSPINGEDLNNFKKECHMFVINCSSAPDGGNHGFLDVSYFNGALFAPGAVTKQVFTNFDNNYTFTRLYYWKTDTWTTWKNISKGDLHEFVVNDNFGEHGFAIGIDETRTYLRVDETKYYL